MTPGFPGCLWLLLLTLFTVTALGEWMYQRHGFRDGWSEGGNGVRGGIGIVFGAPTCQLQASVCLHRPNPIAVRSFKPRAWESLWKDH